MLVNKWVLVILGALVTLLGYLATVDWATLIPTKAGVIISAIGILKMVIASLMPAPSQAVITNTGGTLVTHT